MNKLGESHAIKIERSYFQLKLKELQLTYEYQEKVKAEKDEQRRIAEQIREEERAQKEFEKWGISSLRDCTGGCGGLCGSDSHCFT